MPAKPNAKTTGRAEAARQSRSQNAKARQGRGSTQGKPEKLPWNFLATWRVKDGVYITNTDKNTSWENIIEPTPSNTSPRILKKRRAD